MLHSLLPKAETGQASGRLIRGTSEHARTVIKQARKRLSTGEAQATLLVLLQDFREGKRLGHGGSEQEKIGWGHQVKARA